MLHRGPGWVPSAIANLLVLPVLACACSDGTSDARAPGSGGAPPASGGSLASGGTEAAIPETGGTGSPTGGALGTGGSSSPTGGTSSSTGGTTTSSGGTNSSTGGTTTSSGGTSSSTGGTTTSSGGTSSSTGGTTTSSGGTSSSTGGTTASTGGASASSGGTTASTGGASEPEASGGATGGADPNAGGAGSSTGGTEPYEPVVIGTARTGEGTFYNGSGVVNCSYEGITDEMLIAALNTTDYGSADWCGACASVQGPNGEVMVRIVDSCPSCAAGDLDFSPAAFDLIADRVAGRVDITWTFVSCDVTGPVTYFFKEGSSEGWTAILVQNHRLPITKMEWSKDQSSWTEMRRETYNYFIEASGFGIGSTYVRITATEGQVLVDRLPTSREYLLIEGDANFE